MIVEAAVQEDVDVVSLSILSGAHMTLFARVLELLRERDAGDILVIGGGIIPEEDAVELKRDGGGRDLRSGHAHHRADRVPAHWFESSGRRGGTGRYRWSAGQGDPMAVNKIVASAGRGAGPGDDPRRGDHHDGRLRPLRDPREPDRGAEAARARRTSPSSATTPGWTTSGSASCCSPGRCARWCAATSARTPSSSGSTSTASWSWSSCRRGPSPSGSARAARASPPSTPRPAWARSWPRARRPASSTAASSSSSAAIRADFAFIKAWRGDPWGNLVYRETARNFNPMMATAADIVIAEVEELVPLGALDPDSGAHPVDLRRHDLRGEPREADRAAHDAAAGVSGEA